jgi:hypothetical protein
MRCSNCQAYRTRLNTCSVCGDKLCGCCSIKLRPTNRPVCCYPGDPGCAKTARERAAAERCEAVGQSSGYAVEWVTPDESKTTRRVFDDLKKAVARYSRLTSLFYADMYFGAEVRLLDGGRVTLSEVIS